MSGKRKKLGLVLSAGAARGFAHIGVLQSLLSHNIPVDIITGTSMGALLGGIYATGADIDYMARFSKHVAVSKFLDFSLKDGGIVRGKKVEELMKVLTGNKSIEQLQVPFACAAINVVCTKRSEPVFPCPEFLPLMKLMAIIILMVVHWRVCRLLRQKNWGQT